MRLYTGTCLAAASPSSSPKKCSGFTILVPLSDSTVFWQLYCVLLTKELEVRMLRRKGYCQDFDFHYPRRNEWVNESQSPKTSYVFTGSPSLRLKVEILSLLCGQAAHIECLLYPGVLGVPPYLVAEMRILRLRDKGEENKRSLWCIWRAGGFC